MLYDLVFLEKVTKRQNKSLLGFSYMYEVATQHMQESYNPLTIPHTLLFTGPPPIRDRQNFLTFKEPENRLI